MTTDAMEIQKLLHVKSYQKRGISETHHERKPSLDFKLHHTFRPQRQQ